jgi:hypothetical protein
MTSSKTAPVIMTDELLLATPTMNSPDSGAKSFYDVLDFAPGVDYYQAYGSGFGSPNAYQMDGIDSTGIIEPDYNIIDEASVQSFGLPAEYGEFTGVVFNAITKSGSNKFSGLGEFRYNGKNWNSQNITGVPTEKLFDPSVKNTKQSTDQHQDFELQFGGPILKDKLWFFIAGEYYQTIKNPTGTTVQPKWYSPKFLGKLSLQVNPSNRVNLGVDYDNEKADKIVAGPQFPPDVSLNNNYPGYFINLNWTSIFSSNTFLDVKLGYNHKDQNQLPTAGMDISGHYDLATGIYSKNFPSFYEAQYRYLDLNAHLSHYIPEFIKGSHDLKLGIEYRYAKEAAGSGYPGLDHTFYLDLGGQPYLAYQYESTPILDKYFTVLAGFVEDSWKVTKRLILNFGARLDKYRFRFPSPGPGVIFDSTAIAPRLGFAYDLSGGKTVLKFHYGHYYDSLNSGFFYYADTRQPTRIYKMWDGSQYVEYNRVAGTSYSVDPNLKMSFIREYTAALEQELFKDASLNLSFFYRKLARAIGTINTLAQWEKITIVNPGPDGITGTADDSTIDVWNQTNPGQNAYLITNPTKGQSPAMIEEPEHHASGFQLVFNKRFSHRWQVMVSYVYSVSKGNIERPPVADMGMDPNLFINESGPNARYSGQPHFFKILGNILLPLDINLGLYFYYISPHTYRPYFGTVLNQGYETIYAETWGKYHVDPQRNININLAKIVKISNFSVTLLGDVYNLLNSHDVRWDYDVFNAYGPYFGKIFTIQNPRTFRIGFRIAY